VDLVRASLQKTILPILYKETVPNEALIFIMDMGPFKHKVDKGLPCRKAAFQCLATLLEVAPHRLSLTDFLKHIRKGLSDHDDIIVLTFQIFYHLGKWHGNSLLEVLDELPPAFTTCVKTKMQEASGNEGERAKDILRSAVRTLVCISKIPGVELCTRFSHFFKLVCNTTILKPIVKVILAEMQ